MVSSAFLKYCQSDNLSVSALLNVVFADDLEDEQFGIDGDLWHVVKRKLCACLNGVVVVFCCALVVRGDVSVGVDGAGTVDFSGFHP